MDDFVLIVEIDVCSRSFVLLSENGEERLIACETTDEFLRVLRVCDQLLPPEAIIYKELVTQTDKQTNNDLTRKLNRPSIAWSCHQNYSR